MAQSKAIKRKKESDDPHSGFRDASLFALGTRIRAEREKVTNQEEAAAMSGLARAYYGGLERGEQNVSVVNLFRIAVALKCEPRDLMPPLADLLAAFKE